MAHFSFKNYLQVAATGFALATSVVAANPMMFQYDFYSPTFVGGIVQPSFKEARITGFYDDQVFTKQNIGGFGLQYKYTLTNMAVESRTRYTDGRVDGEFALLATEFGSGFIQLSWNQAVPYNPYLVDLKISGLFSGANPAEVLLQASDYYLTEMNSSGRSNTSALEAILLTVDQGGRAILKPGPLTSLMRGVRTFDSASVRFASDDIFANGGARNVSIPFSAVPASNVPLPGTLAMLSIGLIAGLLRSRR